MMPKRRRTRAQNKARVIAAERAHNRAERRARHSAILDSPRADNDADPPPF
jgi:hypothetical protein